MASTVQHASKFQRFLNSETGPRTVHFWAPVFKWALVAAGLNDIHEMGWVCYKTKKHAFGISELLFGWSCRLPINENRKL